MFINYGAGNSSPIASIKALIQSGYNGGTWNGSGINSTGAAATPGYGIGYADAKDPGNPAGLSSGTIEIRYTLLGDANLDGLVNGADFGILAANFNKSATSWDQADFNYDGLVNGADFGDLAANFNKGATSPAEWAQVVAFAQANGLMTDVPEPIGLSSLGALAVGLLVRRRPGKS
jgi:hypothetical protein